MKWNRKVQHRRILNLWRNATASSFGGRGLKNVRSRFTIGRYLTQRPSNLQTTSCARHCNQPPKRRANERESEEGRP